MNGSVRKQNRIDVTTSLRHAGRSTMGGQSKMAYEILLDGEMLLGEEKWDFWLVRFRTTITTEDAFSIAPSIDAMERVDGLELTGFREQFRESLKDEWFPIVGLCRHGDSPVFVLARDEKTLAASGKPHWHDGCTFFFMAPSAVKTAA